MGNTPEKQTKKIKGVPIGTHKIEVRKARKATATDSITIREKETSSIEIICKELTKEATFHGGQREMSQYIIENISYPSSAAARGIKGVVIVSFTVSETGKIQDVEITKSVDKSLDKEAATLVQGMPKWEPAEINGTPVRSFVSIPINFSD